jgi:hypothetical protein
MKKVLVLLMALTMTASLVGCGGGSDTDETSAPKTEATTVASAEEGTTVEETTQAPASTSTEMAPGVTGDGPQELTSIFFDAKVPEGLKYEVYTHAFADDTNGTIQLNFGKTSALDGSIVVSTQRMTPSLDECVTRCIELRNLDTYKEGKSEVVGDVTFGDTTYKEVKISNEWGSDTNYVTYFKTAAGLDGYVEITVKDKYLSPDDELVKELINSIVYKK